jgi:hypothetical protein
MSHVQTIDHGAEFDSFFASSSAPRQTYFSRDCLPIVAAAQDSPDALPSIAALVLCSIRQPFFLMHVQMADIAKNGTNARCLFGWKRTGLQYVVDHRADLHGAARRAYGKPEELDNLILRYLDIPGLGIVKASFLAQMTIGDGACMDSHNLGRLSFDTAYFKTPKILKESSIRKLITAYNATWRANGDSAYWWDSWCDHMAENSAKWFRDGAHVSHMHRLAITTRILA